MPYTMIAPPASLSRYVQSFWINRDDALPDARVFRPVTDGCPGLLIHSPEIGTLVDQDQKVLPSLCLYGQTIKPREISASGRFDAIGVSLHPAALPALFGIDADELTDTCVDLETVAAQPAVQLADQLVSTSLLDRQIDLLTTYLLTTIRNSVPIDGLTDYVLAELIRTQGRLSLGELRHQVNVSERSRERKFRRMVGIRPKLFARICRFQASLAQLRTNRYAKLSDIAFDNGYADQSHFIRSFQEFAGCTPKQYRKETHLLEDQLPLWSF